MRPGRSRGPRDSTRTASRALDAELRVAQFLRIAADSELVLLAAPVDLVLTHHRAALAFACMMSVGNLGLTGSDLLGAHTSAAFALTLPTMIMIYATSTMLGVVLRKFVPASLLRRSAA
jgi:hypothetical protein